MPPELSKDEILASLSHELRTRLNAVLGWTRMLRRGEVPPDRTRHILDTIERNAAEQMQIIERLLELSSTTPAEQPPTAPAPVEEPFTKAPTQVTLRGSRVLAVDDDAATQELVATMLLMYGVSVRTAGGTSDAL